MGRFIIHTQGQSVLYVRAKFEVDSCDTRPCRQETIKKRIDIRIIRLLINFSKTITTKNIVTENILNYMKNN